MDPIELRSRARQAIEDPLPPRLRDRAALAVALVAFAAGLAAFVDGRTASGVWLNVDGGRLVVSYVESWSPAAGQILLNDVVVSVDGTPTFPIPGHTDRVPTGDALYGFAGRSPTELEVVSPSLADDIASGAVEYGSNSYYLGSSIWATGSALAIGIAILVLGTWYMTSGRAGRTLQGLGRPIAAATSVPLLVVPLDLLLPVGYPIATALATAAALLLADGLSALIPDPVVRRGARVGALALGGLVLLAGFGMSSDPPPPSSLAVLRWAGLATIPILAALAAAPRSASALPERGTSPSGRLVESNELVAVGFTPGVAALTMTFPTGGQPFVLPILLWIAALLVAARFTVRPLLRLATRANLQRDLVVAATEAERARLAADLHDDALQDLTMLVRRLDAAGDVEGAAQARAVADRLREICGDLRLPILDDLGVGPALDWLVLRIERLAGGAVRLERTEDDRPPVDVELAFFRVAQEALANAVKHGKPPITVRYRASPTGASLSIDDSGDGIGDRAREEAAANGDHFGLLNMQQRAEQIGAILDVRPWPTGGTHVALEWRAR